MASSPTPFCLQCGCIRPRKAVSGIAQNPIALQCGCIRCPSGLCLSDTAGRSRPEILRGAIPGRPIALQCGCIRCPSGSSPIDTACRPRPDILEGAISGNLHFESGRSREGPSFVVANQTYIYVKETACPPWPLEDGEVGPGEAPARRGAHARRGRSRRHRAGPLGRRVGLSFLQKKKDGRGVW